MRIQEPFEMLERPSILGLQHRGFGVLARSLLVPAKSFQGTSKVLEGVVSLRIDLDGLARIQLRLLVALKLVERVSHVVVDEVPDVIELWRKAEGEGVACQRRL